MSMQRRPSNQETTTSEMGFNAQFAQQQSRDAHVGLGSRPALQAMSARCPHYLPQADFRVSSPQVAEGPTRDIQVERLLRGPFEKYLRQQPGISLRQLLRARRLHHIAPHALHQNLD